MWDMHRPMSNADATDAADRDDTANRRDTYSSRRAFLTAAGAGAALSLAGCIGAANSMKLDEVSYRHRFKFIGLVAAPHVAGEKAGNWEDEGLTVNFRSSSGSQETAKSVATGNDHFGDGGMGVVLKAIEGGAPLVILAQELDPIRGIVTLKKNDINSWTDLEGKTIGKFPFAITNMVEEAMKRKGVDLSKVEFQNVSPDASFKLLLNGKLDALSRYVPQAVHQLEYMGHEAVGFYTSNVINYLGPCVYTRKSMIENHPETVKAFLGGWLKNYQMFANKTDKAINLYKPKAVGSFNEELERKSLPELFAAQVPSPEVGTTHGKGWTVENQMQITADTFKKAGVIDTKSSIDSYYTNKFQKENQGQAKKTADAIYQRLEDYDIGPTYV